MAGLIVNLLWFLIYAILLAGVVWLVLYGIKTFVTPIPPRLEQGVWFIILILILIFFITALVGGGGMTSMHPPGFR